MPRYYPQQSAPLIPARVRLFFNDLTKPQEELDQMTHGNDFLTEPEYDALTVLANKMVSAGRHGVGYSDYDHSSNNLPHFLKSLGFGSTDTALHLTLGEFPIEEKGDSLIIRDRFNFNEGTGFENPEHRKEDAAYSLKQAFSMSGSMDTYGRLRTIAGGFGSPEGHGQQLRFSVPRTK